MTTLETLGLKEISLTDVADLYKSCGERTGNPAVVDGLIRNQIENVPEPTWDKYAPEKVRKYIGHGATVIMVIGPHLSDKDHIEVGAAAYQAGLEELARNMGFLAKAEYWFDFGEETRQLMDDALALPAVRGNQVKNAFGEPFDPALFRFDQDTVEKAHDMLNKLVATTADNGKHIGLFGSGTRYSRAEDTKGDGPYKNISVKDGLEHFGREILAGERAKSIGHAVLLPVGIYAPEDNLSQPPHVHFASPREITSKTEPGGIITLASTGITHAVTQARHAASSLARR